MSRPAVVRRLWARLAIRLGVRHVHTPDCGRFE